MRISPTVQRFETIPRFEREKSFPEGIEEIIKLIELMILELIQHSQEDKKYISEHGVVHTTHPIPSTWLDRYGHGYNFLRE